jgi:hypothetical protein
VSGDIGVPYTFPVSSVEQPEEPAIRLYPPEEALEHARRLPPREERRIEDLTDEEWNAFQAALADA